jgi:hypothetical protein
LSKKEAARIRPKHRVAFIVIDRKNEARGPMVLDTNMDVFQGVLTIMSDQEFGDITKAADGCDINISYKKDGGNGFPEYIVQPKRSSSPLSANPQQQSLWLSKDWFEEFEIGRASEAGYIQACLDGTEVAYVESRKGQQQQQQAQQPVQHSQTVQSAPVQPQPPQLSVSGVVVSAEPTVMHRFLAGTKFWAAVNGAAVEQTVEQVCQRLKTEKPEAVLLMMYDQSGGWQNAKALGFEVTIPSPPPPPAAPAVPPPPMSPAEYGAK